MQAILEPSPRAAHAVQRTGSWIGTGAQALRRQLVLMAMVVPQVAVMSFMLAVAGLIPAGVGLLLVPTCISALRALARAKRRLAWEWSGLVVEDSYRPYQGVKPGVVREGLWLLTDPGTWRDVVWLFMDLVVGFTLALFPPAVFGYGLWGLVTPLLWVPVISRWDDDHTYLFVHVHGGPTLAVVAVLGVVQLSLVLLLAPKFLDLHNHYEQWALGPTERMRLAGKVEVEVEQLSLSRRDALDTSAAEIRRIERDLHDGAQSRLVAMGMTLSATQTLLQSNPQAAEALLVEAKNASAKALGELRDLVRGIHPPVLADRGLFNAVRALVADFPLPVAVTASVDERYSPAVESAAYFAVSELLSNAAKHSGATHLSITLDRKDDLLLLRIVDNGRGGANVSAGTGLRGLEQRLAAFDGTLSLNSPVGGPTTVNIALPLPAQDRSTLSRSSSPGY
jgi:signal transduction histidine kinase